MVKRVLMGMMIGMLVGSAPEVSAEDCPWWDLWCTPTTVEESRDATIYEAPPERVPESERVYTEETTYSSRGTEAWSCMDIKTLRKTSLTLTFEGNYLYEDTVCASDEVCVGADQLNPANILEGLATGEDATQKIAEFLPHAACVKAVDTDYCPNATSTFNKLTLIKDPLDPTTPTLIIGYHSACPAETMCVLGACVKPGTVTCTDSDKTDYATYAATQQMNDSQFTAGAVKVIQADGSSEKHVDECKMMTGGSTFPFLLEYACLPDGSFKQLGIQCDPNGDATGKCVQDALGGRCLVDSDSDGVADKSDNCPNNYNPDQLDADKDGVGDVCADNVIQLDTFMFKHLALQNNGKLWGWGGGNKLYMGQFKALAPIPDLPSVASFAIGSNHDCAVTKAGTAWCWGKNDKGQLGNGTLIDGNPKEVFGLTDVASIALGYWHTCAVRKAGDVWCWGENGGGQLGSGTFDDSSIPVQVKGLNNIASLILRGGFTLALGKDGVAWGWGDNDDGQLGNGTTQYSNLPVQVKNLNPMVSLSTNGLTTCALQQDGTVWCWGKNSQEPVNGVTGFSGMLGNGTKEDSLVPVQVKGLTNITSIQVSPSAYHSCAVRQDGTVWCWGKNVEKYSVGPDLISILGDGTNMDTLVPVQAKGLVDASTVDINYNNSCVVTKKGGLWCWGHIAYAKLPDGTAVDTTVPVQSNALSGVQSVKLGLFNACATTKDGKVWCWGSYGNPANSEVYKDFFNPVQVKFQP